MQSILEVDPCVVNHGWIPSLQEFQALCANTARKTDQFLMPAVMPEHLWLVSDAAKPVQAE